MKFAAVLVVLNWLGVIALGFGFMPTKPVTSLHVSILLMNIWLAVAVLKYKPR